jgi:GGDEF domain-containing protein
MNVFSSMDLALCVLSAYVGFYHLVVYLSRRSSTVDLPFSLLCFAIALNNLACVGLYSSDSLQEGQHWQTMQYFCAVAISMGFVAFTYGLIGKKSDAMQRAVLALFCGLFVGGAFALEWVIDFKQPMERTMTAFGSSVTYFEHSPGNLWKTLFVAQLVGMCWLYGLLIAEYLRTKKRELLLLLAAFLLFFVSGVLDMLISVDAIRLVYTAEYAFLVMILAMDFILIKRFIGLFDEVESLNLHLGEMVEERTAEVRKLADELEVANEQLEKKNNSLKIRVDRDAMTALLNHAAFHRRLAEMLNFCQREKFPLTVMLLDVDHFKHINDEYGHQAGDRVISEVAASLRESSRNYDLKSRYQSEAVEGNPPQVIAGRYGGDEFGVAFPNCGVLEARTIAARICEKVRSLRLPAQPGLKVTSSIGCAVLVNPSACEEELALIELADQALYDAKHRGRDGFSVFEWPGAATAQGAVS